MTDRHARRVLRQLVKAKRVQASKSEPVTYRLANLTQVPYVEARKAIGSEIMDLVAARLDGVAFAKLKRDDKRACLIDAVEALLHFAQAERLGPEYVHERALQAFRDPD
jgi:hypothetical protein